jgi:predicted Rossmann-fold nucleotide-binding protein
MELLDLADAYVAIGNSTGTLTEIAMAWDYMTKGFLPQKPMMLIGESWKRFMEYIEGEDQFLPFLHLVEHHLTMDAAVAELESYFGTSLHLPDLDILPTDR